MSDEELKKRLDEIKEILWGIMAVLGLIGVVIVWNIAAEGLK